MVAATVTASSQQPEPAPPAAGAQAPAGARSPGGSGRREARRAEQARRAAQALRGGRVPEVSRRRQPGGDLGGRAAAPAVRGVRPGRPDLRVDRRGDWLQDRRQAIRPARLRVHEAALGLVLAHRDLRRGADVHADHPVSEVHELPGERVLPDLSAVRPAVLRRGLFPLHLLLRLGEVSSAGASRPGARPQRGGHGDHAHRQLLAHVHDVAEGDCRGRGGDLRLGGGQQLHLDADQRASGHRERRVRRIDRRRVRRVQVPAGEDRRGTGALRLDGLHRQLHRHSARSCRCRSPATGSPRRSTPTRRRSASP